MIVVTGAAGFIGSRVVRALRERDEDIVAVEDFETIRGKRLSKLNRMEGIDWRQSIGWLDRNRDNVDCIIHMGGESCTTAPFKDLYEKNFLYTMSLWRWCAGARKPIIYASSAATYGDGSKGFSDRTPPSQLKPLNGYALTKNAVDLAALRYYEQGAGPPTWYGLKLFNVYGPGEEHKGDMRSMPARLYDQARNIRQMAIFKDGRQKRDFVFVDDCVYVVLWILDRRPPSGLYNIGTGRAESFSDLAQTVGRLADRRSAAVKLIEMPKTLTNHFQSFTQADISKLRAAGYATRFRTMAEGVEDYFSESIYERAS